MYLDRIFQSLNLGMQDQLVTELLELNESTQSYGLSLTRLEIQQMLEERSRILRSYGRVELSMDVTKTLIESFAASPFIRQESYADTLNELHEIFYYLKNETEDRMGDRKLLDWMKTVFGEGCEGSLELLKGRLEEDAREFRRELQRSDSAQEGEDDDWKLKI